MSTPADLSWLFTECRHLGDDGDGFELNETEFLACLLKDCKIQTEELTRRRRKMNLAMKNAKTFLDCCDTFLVSLSNMNMVVGPVYGAVKFIVTISAAKSEILEEVIDGLNEVFDGLPLVTHSVKLSNPSNPDHRVIISVLKAFVTFVKDVKGYVGEKNEPVIQRVIRTFKSTAILQNIQKARQKMRNVLDLAQFGVLINSIKTQAEGHLRGKAGRAVERLHCTNYEHHLAQYVAKTSAIENPCAWSDSHPSIVHWLSSDVEASQLYITGRPGSGKSVFAAHMIQKVAQMISEDASPGTLLLYYFCGADPTVDPYSNLPQKASFKAIAMSFLRQMLSTKNRKQIADITLLEDFLEYALTTQSDKYQDVDLQKWIVKLLPSFDVVRIIIDAVDQCEDAHRGRGLLPWILNDVTAHILLVGCDGSRADKFLASWPRVTLGNTGTTQADLESYSRHVVRSYIPAGNPVDEALVQDIVQRSENMFLYVFFLENLIKEEDMPLFHPTKRLELLRKTPPGIFKMYSYYLYIQLQGLRKLPAGFGLDRALVTILQLLVFSPSAVTWEILLEVLQSSSLPQELVLNRETIETIARRAGGVLFDIRETTYRESVNVRRHHIVPVHRTLVEYFHASDNLHWLDGIIIDSSGHTELETLYKTVAETGPASLLEICCVSLQNRRFQSFLNRYQHAADICRQCLDDSSTRGVPPGSTATRHDLHRAQLRGQLCEDPAFSSCDTVEFEQQWLDRQWMAVRLDLQWSRTCAEEVETYSSEDDKAVPQSLRDEILRLRINLPRMTRHLEICQRVLSELQTWHLTAYAFRNVVFYLHLTNQEAARRQCPSVFEGLIRSYLDQLDLLLSAMARDMSVDSSTAKLAAMICSLEAVSDAARKLVSSPQKSRLYRLLQMMRCLWFSRGTRFRREELWNPLYSAHITAGFRTSVSDRFLRFTLERVLLLFADGEHLCFADATSFIGVGNLSFCIRQLRQLISHHLLFRTFDSGKAKSSGDHDFQLHELGKQGFTKLVILRDVSWDVVDTGSPLPTIPSTTASPNAFITLAFGAIGFLSSRHICFIFSLLSAVADISYGALRIGQTWTWLPFVSAAGAVGCSCAKVRPALAHRDISTTIACAALILLLLSQWRATAARILGASKYLGAGTFCFLLVLLALGQGIWPAIENTTLLYGIVHLTLFAVDPRGMKRRSNELARIGRKYKWHREDQGSGTQPDLLQYTGQSDC